MKPLTLAEKIMADPCASYFLKDTLRRFLDRDIVDALNDAEMLALALRDHHARISCAARAGEPRGDC